MTLTCDVCFCLFSRYSMKVVKATAQVLNTLWQYRDLRTIYKKVSALGQMRTVYTYIVRCVHDVWISTEKKDMSCKYQTVRRLKKAESKGPKVFSFFPPQQDGWNQNHFLTPVSTLERDRFKSQPTLPTSTIQMSPVNHPGRL